MKIEVSLGEAIDKLNILELKLKKISNQEKIIEIKKEIDELELCIKYKLKYDFYYNLLTYVNEFIWNATDKIKQMNTNDPYFSILSNNIFEYNQKRFRIKNWFNILESSNIKEQKSYNSTYINIYIDSIEMIYNKIPEINFLLLEYDIVYFNSNSNESIINTMKNIFKQPNLLYNESDNNYINIEQFTLNENRDIYEFTPINYISGGLLGDFIHQLSVINEIYIETGRKANLYIANIGDCFKYGLETAYNDTFKLVSEQKYIHTYNILSNNDLIELYLFNDLNLIHIYNNYKNCHNINMNNKCILISFNNETHDFITNNFYINLSKWRDSEILFNTNFYNTFKDCYGIEWGKNPWLIIPKDDKWNNKILINYSSYRKIYNVKFNLLYENFLDKLVFIGFEKDGYEDLIKKGISIEYYCPSSLYEFAIAINSCELFIGGYSSPLTIAFACKKLLIIGENDNSADNTFFKDIPYLNIVT
jgi:hypothetical protein